MRFTGDLDLAEDMAQDELLAALERAADLAPTERERQVLLARALSARA